jgi:peptidoglycan-associated lipoprotein
MRNKTSIILVVLLGLTLAACGGKKGVKDGAEDEGVSTTALGDGTGGMGSALGAGGDLATNNKVYFDYDSTSVTDDSRLLIEAHAQDLLNNPGTTVVLEGHADERGTREYNLALAERRALSVAEIMVAYGVARDRMQTISYGEERPESLDHNDSAWALNRRVVILR